MKPAQMRPGIFQKLATRSAFFLEQSLADLERHRPTTTLCESCGRESCWLGSQTRVVERVMVVDSLLLIPGAADYELREHFYPLRPFAMSERQNTLWAHAYPCCVQTAHLR